jgi:hypothetical protein
VSVVLAVALLPVVLYCAVRAVGAGPRARRRPSTTVTEGHHRDVDAWHAVLGAAMVPMVLGRLTGSAAVAVLALAGVALAWSVLSVERTGGAAYARLAVTGAATALMTLPLAGPADAAVPGSPHAGMALGGPSWAPVIGVLVVALAVVVLSASRLVVRRELAVVGRLDACCDVVMAAAMVLMLLGLS